MAAKKPSHNRRVLTRKRINRITGDPVHRVMVVNGNGKRRFEWWNEQDEFVPVELTILT